MQQTVQAEDVIFLTTTETTGTTGGQREETMKLMSTADNRQCANNGWSLIALRNLKRFIVCLSP